jgi:hypothetical protein
MDILSRFWEMPTPSVGTFVLIGVAIGLLVRLTAKLIKKLGAARVLLIIGVIAIAGYTVRYRPRPSAERAQSQPAAVKRSAPSRVEHKAHLHRRRRYVQKPY